MMIRLFPLSAHRQSMTLVMFLGWLIGSVALLSGCTETAATPGTEQPYYHQAASATLEVVEGYSVARTYIGRVQVKQDAHIGFEQSGKVARLFVYEGETVRKGDLLAQQDVELLGIERQELDAQLQQINADLALVETNLTRLRSLKKRGFTSDQSLDELQAQRKVLLANRKRTQASIQGNELRIRKASLYAPYDAIISQRLIDEGEVVGAGAPALTLLQQGNSEIKVGVPVDMLSQLEQQQDFSVSVANRTYPVRLLTRGSDVNPATRTVQLRFELQGEHQLVNGQLAYLKLDERFNQPGYWVPLAALTDGIRGLWNLYTLQPDAGGDTYTIQSRNVRVFHSTKDKAFIYAPLIESERYLTGGLHRLVPGQQVVLNKQPGQTIQQSAGVLQP